MQEGVTHRFTTAKPVENLMDNQTREEKRKDQHL